MDTTSFNFFTPTKLIFGSGSLKNLKQIAPLYGKKCLLVSRPKDGSLKAIYKQIETLLDSTGVYVSFFDEIVPNPTLEGINRGVKIASENKVDFVLGVGGGSVMDSAKLIALLYSYKVKQSKTLRSAVISIIFCKYFGKEFHVSRFITKHKRLPGS